MMIREVTESGEFGSRYTLRHASKVWLSEWDGGDIRAAPVWVLLHYEAARPSRSAIHAECQGISRVSPAFWQAMRDCHHADEMSLTLWEEFRSADVAGRLITLSIRDAQQIKRTLSRHGYFK